MKKFILLAIGCFTGHMVMAQNIGIGTATPQARLHVTDSSVVFSASGNIPGVAGSVPLSGSGRRLLWYPDKAAFRAGYVNGEQWNTANIGPHSVAMGAGTLASGTASTALGSGSTASGFISLALGDLCTASDLYTTAIGSVATAAGPYATALGNHVTATGHSSLATGSYTTATAPGATAMGNETHATGAYSFALGREVSTNGMEGAFFFGDADPNNKGTRPIGFANQIAMRFNGGYYFISSDAGGGDIGVRVLAGGNSWSALSDVRLKENFLPVSGEAVLKKIAAMPQYSWNYRGQDAKTFRHYGPMAQEFFAAFGNDELGTIGCDTLINQQDFLGVNLIAIQALERRTSALQKENEELKRRLEKLVKLVLTKE